MQLMWISESTGQIRKISITIRTIFWGIVGAAFFFVILGAIMNFVGFRIAIEQKPEMVRAMGGVITAQQLEEIESAYRDKLLATNDQLQGAVTELGELMRLKEKFAEMATPRSLRNQANIAKPGVGGPYHPVVSQPLDKDLFVAMDNVTDAAHSFKKSVLEIRKHWEKQIHWLDGLPSATPIEGSYKLSSGYGVRIDPFTARLAQHEGLDFSAETGTMIVASGHGTVSKVGFHKEYGNFVEIKHQEGYKTRYAHASEILVKYGQEVRRGDSIARVGSTGRSSGPHLHYEVLKDGGFFRSDTKMDPAGMLVRN